MDAYEQEIVQSFENDEWKSVKDKEQQIKDYQEIAKSQLNRNREINIHLSEKYLMDIQKKAIMEGLPYQTLIASIIHKFNSGQIIERE